LLTLKDALGAAVTEGARGAVVPTGALGAAMTTDTRFQVVKDDDVSVTRYDTEVVVPKKPVTGAKERPPVATFTAHVPWPETATVVLQRLSVGSMTHVADFVKDAYV
jgi:hypothetical protein